MAEPPHPPDRPLRFVAALLMGEAVIFALLGRPAPEAGLNPCLPLGLAGLAGILGLHALLASRHSPQSRLAAFLVAVSFATVLAADLLGALSFLELGRHANLFGLGTATGLALMGVFAARLWGTALARSDHPADRRSQIAGRTSAGWVQLGFVIAFVSSLPTLFGPDVFSSGTTGATGALFALFRLAGLGWRLLLLAASVITVRTASEPEIIRARAVRVNRIMMIWVAFQILEFGFSAALDASSSGSRSAWKDLFPMAWIEAVRLTATTAAALSVARRYQGDPGSYKSDPAPHA